jgi:hypothetical protein
LAAHPFRVSSSLLRRSGKALGITNDYEATRSDFLNLISTLELLRKRNGGFRVRFEFRDEQLALASGEAGPLPFLLQIGRFVLMDGLLE